MGSCLVMSVFLCSDESKIGYLPKQSIVFARYYLDNTVKASKDSNDRPRRGEGRGAHRAHGGARDRVRRADVHVLKKVNGQEFVLSDETPDRMDDVIMADAWDLASFQKNPIALFNHNSNAPIGKWANVRVVDKQLRGHLELAPAGTSDRIDEIRKLIDAGILRAVSVGFRPKESKPRPEADFGMFFTKAELV